MAKVLELMNIGWWGGRGTREGGERERGIGRERGKDGEDGVE